MKPAYSKSILVTFLLSIVVLSSCSSDDDSSVQEEIINPEEAIIGQWNLTARTEHGLEFCELGTKLYFNEDNSMEFDYHEGDDPEDCYNLLFTGNYEILNENQLKFNLESPVESNRNVTYEFSDPTTLLFSFNVNENSIVTETYKKQ